LIINYITPFSVISAWGYSPVFEDKSLELSFAEMPSWVGIVIAVVVAGIVGAFIGSVISKRGRDEDNARSRHAPRMHMNQEPDAPIAQETPAFKRLQQLLEARGISAKEQDARLREFAGEYATLQRKLVEIHPVGESRKSMADDAMEALEEGEFEKAIKIAEKLGAEESAEVLNKLGTACYECDDHEAAVRAFTKGLRLLEKTLGNDHPDVATSLNNLAMIHYAMGRFELAEPLYRRALMIDERVLGHDHPGVATDLNNLALLHKKQGNLEAAEPLLKRALSIKERNFDPGHPSLVTGLKNYASLLRALGRDDEAVAYEDRATTLPPSRTESAT
jgi:tetratricopeptide (TPR) repeat protein